MTAGAATGGGRGDGARREAGGTAGSGVQPGGRSAAVRLWPVLPAPGTNIGELTFPTIHLKVPVVQGTHWDELKLGAGHYMASALPGQGGNVFVSGHRDTVFASLRFLKVGDPIVFSTPYGDFVYRAVRFQIVSKYDTRPLSPTPYETLTLSTCYPFFYVGFAPKRYIVYTRLVSEPKRVLASTGGEGLGSAVRASASGQG
ncbi:MAG: sortase [Alicyclobacillus sp.]|nr:sortase [Alicyclobacillus sp.]